MSTPEYDECTDIEGMMTIVEGLKVAASRLAMGAILGVPTSCRGDKWRKMPKMTLKFKSRKGLSPLES